MNKLKYAIIVFLPNLIIITYFICLNWAEEYAGIHYTLSQQFIVQILGNIMFGMFLFFICKAGFMNKLPDSPSKYIIGVIIIPLIYLLSLIPSLNMSVVYFYAADCIPYYFLFASVYAALFIYSVCQKNKTSMENDGSRSK